MRVMVKRSGVHIDTHKLELQLKRMEPRLERALYALIDYQASRSEAWMKANARWTDRTTNARNSLYTATRHSRGRHEILLSHGVHYGIYLETRFAGRYEIINPALMWTSMELRKNLFRLMGELSKG